MTKFLIKHTTQFKKDVRLAQKTKRNLDLLKAVINKLANGEKLEEKYRDHQLTGQWRNYRECHIQPDWLLIYKVEDDVLVLTLARVGTHSNLFD